ncbi:hypothetical protein [Marinobacter sp.]|uniref:hypothetical protein n=1 Tax=Marinobacter sp. TaxID=50741 RepID=UPI003A8E9F91
MQISTINREASDKTKGFRLQKLRAAKLALEEIEKGSFSNFYIAIEQGEDVSKITPDDLGEEEYFEEDKYYPDSNFTINSHPVKNTLVSFFDLYLQRWRESNNICFGFYTTANIGKESATKLSAEHKIKFPKEKILDLIQSDDIDDSVVDIIHKILIVEYEKQYKDKETSGNLDILKAYDKKSFKKFLKSIRWFFGDEDNEALKTSALVKIKKSQFFNFKLEGKESYILSEILEWIEERQDKANYSERFIDKYQIELIFKKAESYDEAIKKDPVWKSWESIEIPDDTRNLKEKVYSVCGSFDKKEIKRLTRRACAAKIEESDYGKDYLSLKYRVLEACEEIIHSKVSSSDINQERISQIFEELKEKSKESIEELKKDFNYPINNAHSIKSIVLDLFDSCYLSFD